LYGLNPLAIFELAVNGHNDGLAIFLLLVALYLLVRGRRSTGFVSVGLANAYKMSVGLLTPFLLWRTASQEGLAAALKSLVLVVSVWLVMYLPFGIGKSIFAGLGNTVDGYLSNSLPILPAFFGYRSLSASFNLFGIVLFIPCYLYLVYLSGKSNWRTLIIASGLGFLAYFALGAVVVHTWYFIMPLALMVTVPDSFWTRTVIWQTLLLFVSYILLLGLRGMVIDFYTYLIVWLPTLVMAGFWYYRGGKDIIQSMTDRSEQI
jgi:alpha-1,6-mannosyltransferase